VEVGDDSLYLEITFNSRGDFSKTKANLIKQVRLSLLSQARKLGFPIELHLQLFDKTIVHILATVFAHLDIIESFHFKICKTVLGQKVSSPKVMVYGELGRQSLCHFLFVMKVRKIHVFGQVIT
jgi:hypothetical protein